MSLSSVLSFFSLETLDVRLFPPEDANKKKAVVQNASKPKWSSLEFKVYILTFAVVVPLMYKTAMEASNETNPNYPRFERLLSNGWMFGRKVDNSDQQYRFFRDNFFMLAGLIIFHTSLRRFTSIINVKRNQFDFVFGLIFLFGAHGFNATRILIHLGINFSISKIPNKKAAILSTWIYGVSILFINDRFRSYPFGNIITGLSFLDTGFKGIIQRWDVFFNFTLLRMISYNMDYINRKEELSLPQTPPVSVMKDKNEKHIILNDRERLNAPLLISQYNLFNYIAYITYTPLFIAGPIVTFNDFIYQSKHKLPSITPRRVIIYGFRLAFCILVMEFLLHFMYVVAVSKTRAWDGNSPFQMSMIGLFNLNIIWLKLLIPWRLFRLWSMIDGIDPPENMIRCMDNNYSALAFWRAWHRSFNRWVVKYIYIPLGGSKHRVLTSLAVFSFVAIWHDIELKLLLWGWLIVLFLMPELLLSNYFKQFDGKWWYRHLAAVGGVANIWMMMIANLFGFCLGKDGTIALLKEMFQTFKGLKFFVTSTFCLFCGVQVMFEMREAELRRGVNVRC